MTEERSKGRKVCYYYDGDVGNYYYGQGNVHIKKIFHKVFENYTPASGTGLLDPKIWSGLGVSNPNSF